MPTGRSRRRRSRRRWNWIASPAPSRCSPSAPTGREPGHRSRGAAARPRRRRRRVRAPAHRDRAGHAAAPPGTRQPLARPGYVVLRRSVLRCQRRQPRVSHARQIGAACARCATRQAAAATHCNQLPAAQYNADAASLITTSCSPADKLQISPGAAAPAHAQGPPRGVRNRRRRRHRLLDLDPGARDCGAARFMMSDGVAVRLLDGARDPPRQAGALALPELYAGLTRPCEPSSTAAARRDIAPLRLGELQHRARPAACRLLLRPQAADARRCAATFRYACRPRLASTPRRASPAAPETPLQDSRTRGAPAGSGT